MVVQPHEEVGKWHRTCHPVSLHEVDSSFTDHTVLVRAFDALSDDPGSQNA